MEKKASPVKPCLDCQGLRNGTRSSPDPHEYLVPTVRSQSNSDAETYRCLVCSSDLTREGRGNSSRWS